LNLRTAGFPTDFTEKDTDIKEIGIYNNFTQMVKGKRQLSFE